MPVKWDLILPRPPLKFLIMTPTLKLIIAGVITIVYTILLLYGLYGIFFKRYRSEDWGKNTKNKRK